MTLWLCKEDIPILRLQSEICLIQSALFRSLKTVFMLDGFLFSETS